ncbi:MAG: transposase, partial [Pirellulales bacterium]|nr:transposase [Pirellulales bacterium]
AGPIPHVSRRRARRAADSSLSTRRACSCPCCGSPSQRVHSGYERRLSDLPWHGLEVRIRWRSRKYFCDNAACSRRIFVERLPEVAEVRSRRTARLELTLRLIALACGGEPGARLADRLGMKASGDSLLRILRNGKAPDAAEPNMIGVDDWAYRRGRRYGTIICDLETHHALHRGAPTAAASASSIVAEDFTNGFCAGVRLYGCRVKGLPGALRVLDLTLEGPSTTCCFRFVMSFCCYGVTSKPLPR